MNGYGWTGKTLWVDLTERKVSTVPTSDYAPEEYIGGMGLNARIFWEMGAPRVDAFSPDNPLLIAVGPTTGTAGPFNRATLCGIAPQSYPRELFAYSNCGGKFPSELKFVGYDALVVVGKASAPVKLSIHNDEVKIEDARRVWGLNTFEAQKELTAKDANASVLTIGPAGENLCRFAIALNETASAAGQGGFGAVMGSKNLKAIRVRGTGTQKVARPDDLMELMRQRMDAGEWLVGGAQSWGRYPLVGGRIASDMRTNYMKRTAGCHGCTYQCMGFYKMPGIGEGGQMCVEAWYGWFNGGSPAGYWEGNILSQQLGINNYELLGLMSFLRYGGGAFTRQDVGLTTFPWVDHVLEPEYGGQKVHHDFLVELLNEIASGKSILSQGVARAAEQLGPAAMSVYQGLYPANGYMQHHIENVGAALHWATEARDPYAACHDYTSAFGPYPNIAAHFGVPGGDTGASGKKMIYDRMEYQTMWVQHNATLKNTLPICEYASMPYSFFHPPDMDIRIFQSKVLSAVTGVDYSVERLWEAAERIWNLRRGIMVLREDRTRADDDLSHVWFERLVGGAESLASPLDRTKWEALKDRYYAVRGWDPVTGYPTRARLEKLGLKDVADKLQAAGKLG